MKKLAQFNIPQSFADLKAIEYAIEQHRKTMPKPTWWERIRGPSKERLLNDLRFNTTILQSIQNKHSQLGKELMDMIEHGRRLSTALVLSAGMVPLLAYGGARIGRIIGERDAYKNTTQNMTKQPSIIRV